MSQERKEDIIEAAILVDAEEVIQPSGKSGVFATFATTSPKAEDAVISSLNRSGIFPKVVDRYTHKEFVEGRKGKKNSSTFGFSSTTWTSPWNPEGPKPNWGPPPKNPRVN